ncbi:MAG: hypothetical protein EA396_10885 [Anaerolineaceae bacterium]|nr:MAG: hypothetical protein EA396_10885 [Anaerolineaceae bacterium]
MADHPAREPAPQDDNTPRETPASVIFMEMMRRAASAGSADPTPDDEPPAPATRDQPDAPTMSEEERRRAAAIEAERLRRVRRRQSRRKQKRAGVLGGIFLTWFIVLVAAGLIATILSWGTSPDSMSPQLRSEMGRIAGSSDDGAGMFAPIEAAPIIPTPNYAIRIGILSGHMGPENDPGAVCPDGLTEAEINYAVAERVWSQLRQRGYEVDLLEEFDRRLAGYRADLLLSIHANDCRPYAGGASGFLVGQSRSRPIDGADARLVDCIGAYYGRATDLEQRFGFTPDMDGYHVFNRIHPNTPAAIIELGFMLDDREFLVGEPDLMAAALVRGVECFLNNEIDPFGRDSAPPAALDDDPTPELESAGDDPPDAPEDEA